MKTLVLIYYLVFCSLIVNAQNLITNPSFEDIDSCYGAPAPVGFNVFGWSGCLGWSCPTFGSSDLWCQNPVFGNNFPPILGPIGYQYAKTGDNYAGILVHEVAYPEYREYIQNELVNPLETNQYYTLSIYVSTNEDSINYSSCLQAFFSETSVSSSNYLVLQLNPQWKNPVGNYIRDTIGYQLLTGVFKANGGEKFITIGCFDDSLAIDMINKIPDVSSDIYYAIDDISLVKAPIEIYFPNVFSPNNDDINDMFEPIVLGLPDYEIFIYNRWGNLIEKLDFSSPNWNGGKCKEGTYFYVMHSKQLDIKEQGYFQLVR